MAAYTYDPACIAEPGKDRMRFELGDTMVEGKERTTALTDEEISAVLGMFKIPRQWKRAKLACLESICRRFAYEPDTKEGPISFSLGERAKLWREDYEKLKAEVTKGSVSIGAIIENTSNKPPYFYTGMMENNPKGV